MNGVIEKSTGNLLRAGNCDFENDGSFDGDNEELRSDVPFPFKVKGKFDSGRNADYSSWNGSTWTLKTS